MKVILLADVPKLGKKNEMKEVSGGYARNFLLPRKLAVAATDDAVKDISVQKAHGEQKKSDERQKYQSFADQLKKITLRFSVKIGEKGKAFGSISAAKIQAALAQQGIGVDKNWIAMDEPIKSTGEKTVEIRFPHGIKSEVKITVEAE